MGAGSLPYQSDESGTYSQSRSWVPIFEVLKHEPLVHWQSEYSCCRGLDPLDSPDSEDRSPPFPIPRNRGLQDVTTFDLLFTYVFFDGSECSSRRLDRLLAV